MSNRYSNKKKNENINTKSMFSIVCLCIIGLAVVIYFSTNNINKNTVSENTTVKVTTEVQKALTLKETTTEKEEKATTKTAKITTKKTEPLSMKADKDNTPYKSDYAYPLGEAVQKGYSEELVLDNTMGDYRAHAGVDFKGAKGDTVKAVNKGIVTDVYEDNLWGNVVEIDHGGKLVAKYCGLDSVSVQKGDTVEKGEKIATLGKIPAENSDGVHLHFETRLNSKPVNPLDVMSKTE